MSELTVRDRIIRALEDLPQDATFEDASERPVFLAKIEAGLAELNTGKGIPHDEAERQLGM
jgi:predicted transcriptional regulator